MKITPAMNMIPKSTRVIIKIDLIIGFTSFQYIYSGTISLYLCSKISSALVTLNTPKNFVLK